MDKKYLVRIKKILNHDLDKNTCFGRHDQG